MAELPSNTIDIVTTNGRYTALRENDPIWSGFLPDAEILGNDKEYLVSESVSRAIDSQWNMYMKLREYLDGIAYVEFNTNSLKLLRGVDLCCPHTYLTRIDEHHATVSDRQTYPIWRLRWMTRSHMLEEGASAAESWRFHASLSVGEIPHLASRTTEVSEIYGHWYTTYNWNRCARDWFDPNEWMSGNSDSNVDMFSLLLTARSSPEHLIYSDTVNRIGYILNLPDGWEYWVPIRGHHTTDANSRQERIHHAIKAGRVARQLGTLARTGSVRMSGALGYYYGECLSIQEEMSEDLMDFLHGAYHLATLSDFRDLTWDTAHLAGFVWDDILYYLTASGEPHKVPGIYSMANLIVNSAKPSESRMALAIVACHAILYPDSDENCGCDRSRYMFHECPHSDEGLAATLNGTRGLLTHLEQWAEQLASSREERDSSLLRLVTSLASIYNRRPNGWLRL